LLGFSCDATDCGFSTCFHQFPLRRTLEPICLAGHNGGLTAVEITTIPRETLEFEYNWTGSGCKFVRIRQDKSTKDPPALRPISRLISSHKRRKTSVFAVYDVDFDAARQD
jgi:hypothetical protein